jgi:glutamate carboxypeptidase
MPEKSISYGADIFVPELDAYRPHLVKLLRTLVEIESPSDDKAAVDRCVELVAGHAAALGGRVRRYRQRGFGDLLELRFGPKRSGTRSGTRPLMLLGHLDTVWPMGTLATMPYRAEKGRIWGPGVLDMKAGVAMALTAIEFLQEHAAAEMQPTVLLLVSDEEVGSPASRPVTEKIARECGAVYVLEPAQGIDPGAYKTARKGIGHYRVEVEGVAAHSGVDFEKGHSAVAELAHQIGLIEEFTDLSRGITANVGTIGGGTRSNVVAAHAWAEVDVRIASAGDVKKIDQRFRKLRVRDRHCVLKVEGGLNRPPMERTKGTVALFQRAATLAATMGFDLQEAATGGGSDGNFTSALGIPTLDGMGAVGEGAHATHESVVEKDLIPRTALLAAMMTKPKG